MDMLMVDSSSVDALIDLQDQILNRVTDESIPISVALAVLQDLIDEYNVIDLVPDWHISPDKQIKKVSAFLESYAKEEVGFLPEDIPPVPLNFKPATPTEVLMLMVYLPNADHYHGAQRTLEAWWDFFIPQGDIRKMSFQKVKTCPSHVSTIIECEHRPGIRWVAFDPYANKGCSVKECREDQNLVKNLAGSEVITALAIFPNWAHSWCGTELIHPFLGAYICITNRTEENLSGKMKVPQLVFLNTSIKSVGSIVSWADIRSPENSIPTVREC